MSSKLPFYPIPALRPQIIFLFILKKVSYSSRDQKKGQGEKQKKVRKNAPEIKNSA
jgi:hypothetical protein